MFVVLLSVIVLVEVRVFLWDVDADNSLVTIIVSAVVAELSLQLAELSG